jgi:hypothetical protein
MKDILREPVELIDSDLDEVAGGRGEVEVRVSHVNGGGNYSTANFGGVFINVANES